MKRLFAAVALAAALLAGCARTDDPKGLVERLKRAGPEQRQEIIDALVRLRDRAFEPAAAEARNPDPAVRALAAEVLGRLKSEKALKAVEPLLSDQEASVRRAAVKALRSLVPVRKKQAIALLKQMLRDPDTQCASTAAVALSETSHPDAVMAVNELLRGQPSPPSILVARSVYARDGRGADLLLRGLTTADGSLRAFTVQQVLGLGESFVPALVARVRSLPAAPSAAPLAQALAQRASDEAVQKKLAACADAAALALLCSQIGLEASLCQGIGPAVAQYGDKPWFEALWLQYAAARVRDKLIGELDTGDLARRKASVRALAVIGDARSVQKLEDVLKYQVALKADAARALAAAASPGAVPLLRETLANQTETADTRFEAAVALAKLGQADGIRYLLDQLAVSEQEKSRLVLKQAPPPPDALNRFLHRRLPALLAIFGSLGVVVCLVVHAFTQARQRRGLLIGLRVGATLALVMGAGGIAYLIATAEGGRRGAGTATDAGVRAAVRARAQKGLAEVARLHRDMLLAFLRPEGTTDAWLSASQLAAKDPMQLWGVVRTLGEIDEKRANPVLLTMLTARNPGGGWILPDFVRWTAAEALGRTADAAALPELQKLLGSDEIKDPGVRYYVGWAVRRLGAEKAGG